MPKKAGVGGPVGRRFPVGLGSGYICERRIEVIMKIQKKVGSGGFGRGEGRGGQGGCVRRI